MSCKHEKVNVIPGYITEGYRPFLKEPWCHSHSFNGNIPASGRLKSRHRHFLNQITNGFIPWKMINWCQFSKRITELFIYYYALKLGIKARDWSLWFWCNAIAENNTDSATRQLTIIGLIMQTLTSINNCILRYFLLILQIQNYWFNSSPFSNQRRAFRIGMWAEKAYSKQYEKWYMW